MDISERVPYGSAYGLENLAAQKALEASAIVALDEAMGAFGELYFHHAVEDLGQNHAAANARQVFDDLASRQDVDPIMVSGKLPEAYKSGYASFGFLKDWVITLTVVGWKLAQPEPLPLTNVAEELALHVMIEDALTHFEDRLPENPEAEEQLRNLYETAFEDNDFELLYDGSRAEGQPDLGEGLERWFLPFGSGVDRGVPHPFLSDR